MVKLAVNGGEPVRRDLFPVYKTIGEEEKLATLRVLESGNLSQFLGAWHGDFYGGPAVREFESCWKETFSCRHAVSVNSATSGLITAVGACCIEPGDEVIVSPYTMTASAMAPVFYGAVPVFADIDDHNFGLCPRSIEERITTRTKAIIVVHIFGNPAKMDEIMSVARRHRLKVIEDCAQSPLALYKGRACGTIGDIGVFSLNYHKHIHTGEGGVVTTNDDDLAERCQLIRNHGEAVVEGKGVEQLSNTHGQNYRLTELQAAIGIEQLKKLPRLLDIRLSNAAYLAKRLQRISGLVPPKVESDCRHVYYIQPLKFDRQAIGIPRDTFVNAIRAELPSAVMRETTPLISAGYVKPLYLQPFFQRRATLCSFNCPRYQGKCSYDRGLCPVAERMHFQELITHEYIRPGMTQSDLDDVVLAFEKVTENAAELRSLQ
jgi:dTDP-4-amino-4,6-dideoxygalactose transaminase